MNDYGFVLTNVEQISEDIYTTIARGSVSEGGICMVTGPLKSGKSLVAVYLNKKFVASPLSERKVCFCQPALNRTDVPINKIVSRSGREMDACSFESKSDIKTLFHNHDVIVLNEFQFTPLEMQSTLVQEIMWLKKRGGWFIGLGLYHTSQGGEFLISALLQLRATKTYGLWASCEVCGNKADKFSQRLIDGKVVSDGNQPELLRPSNIVTYQPRCDRCFVASN